MEGKEKRRPGKRKSRKGKESQVNKEGKVKKVGMNREYKEGNEKNNDE